MSSVHTCVCDACTHITHVLDYSTKPLDYIYKINSMLNGVLLCNRIKFNVFIIVKLGEYVYINSQIINVKL